MADENNMTVPEAIEAGAKIFADAEEAIEGIEKAFGDPLRHVFMAIHFGGQIGGIEAEAYAARAAAPAAQIKSDVYEFHAELTERAKAQGIDLPSPRSGGR